VGREPNRNLKIRLIACLFALLACVIVQEASALQTVMLKEGATQFIDISQKDLNVVKLPGISNLKAYTVSRMLDVKVEGDSIYINVLDKSATAPQELFIVAPGGTYLLMLVPKGVPAEMVIARTPAEALHDATLWEQSHDHISGLKELIKAMYLESPPMGFALNKDSREVRSWQGTHRKVMARYVGASLEGEVQMLTNVSRETIRVAENEFYDRGVLAVSVDRHEVPPKGNATIYLISRSATQKDMNSMLKRYSPLEMLRDTGRRTTP
jgi:conjugal transfer pilus assembly protein TraK